MEKPFNNGAPKDGFVELADEGDIAATEDASHGVVMFQFFDRGVALLLTYSEVLALGRVMEAAVAQVGRRGQVVNGADNGRG